MEEQVVARLNGGVAQLGEHLPCKQGVKSSNLSVSIVNRKIHLNDIQRKCLVCQSKLCHPATVSLIHQM